MLTVLKVHQATTSVIHSFWRWLLAVALRRTVDARSRVA
jgi:hypothetical protein